MQAELMTKLHVKTEDEKDCWITGLAMLSPDEILIVDYNNSCVKMLSLKEKKIITQYKSLVKPWNVTKINSETAAVTFPHADKILFLTILEKLSESHKIKARYGYYGLDYCNGIFAASMGWPPAIHILDMKGRILREITKIFTYPGDLHVRLSHDAKEVFVSATNDNAIYELTTDGLLMDTIKDEKLKSVRGIAVTSHRTMFVCSDNIKEDCHKVSMIVPTIGKIVPVAMENVQSPRCLLFCEVKKRIYISETSRNDECNYLKVYNWKYTEHI